MSTEMTACQNEFLSSGSPRHVLRVRMEQGSRMSNIICIPLDRLETEQSNHDDSGLVIRILGSYDLATVYYKNYFRLSARIF